MTIKIAILPILKKKFPARGQQFSAPCNRTFKKLRFFDKKNKFFVKRVSSTTRVHFWKPCPVIFWQRPIFLRSVGIMRKKKENSFRVDLSPENVPIDSNNAVLTTLPKNFCRETNVFYEMPKNVQEQNFQATKHLFVKKSTWSRKSKFW